MNGRLSPKDGSVWPQILGNTFQTIPDVSFLDAENVKKIEFFCETLNGRLPLEHSSDSRETLAKRVSEDLQIFVFADAESIFFRKYSCNDFRGRLCCSKKLVSGGAMNF